MKKNTSKKINKIIATFDEGGFFARVEIECDATAASNYARRIDVNLPNLLCYDVQKYIDSYVFSADFAFEDFHEFRIFMEKNISTGIFHSAELGVERGTLCLFSENIDVSKDPVRLGALLAQCASVAAREGVNACKDSTNSKFDAVIKLFSDGKFRASINCEGGTMFSHTGIGCTDLKIVVDFLKSSDALASIVTCFVD